MLALSACSERVDQATVTRTEFGADWPFAVESGTLDCERGAVTFTTGGRTFALNQIARAQMGTRGWLDTAEIAADGVGMAVVGVGDRERGLEALIEKGGTLCGPPLLPGGAAQPPLRR